jgi:hypothetical protein
VRPERTTTGGHSRDLSRPGRWHPHHAGCVRHDAVTVGHAGSGSRPEDVSGNRIRCVRGSAQRAEIDFLGYFGRTPREVAHRMDPPRPLFRLLDRAWRRFRELYCAPDGSLVYTGQTFGRARDDPARRRTRHPGVRQRLYRLPRRHAGALLQAPRRGREWEAYSRMRIDQGARCRQDRPGFGKSSPRESPGRRSRARRPGRGRCAARCRGRRSRPSRRR